MNKPLSQYDINDIPEGLEIISLKTGNIGTIIKKEFGRSWELTIQWNHNGRSLIFHHHCTSITVSNNMES